jgi:hypothetical protein
LNVLPTAARARPLGKRVREVESLQVVTPSKTAPSVLSGGESGDEQNLPHKNSMTTIRPESAATVKASKSLNRRSSRNSLVIRSLFPSNSTTISPVTTSPGGNALSQANAVSIPPIRRPSTSRRTQIENWLMDVMSEPCLSARASARKQDEVLFREPSPRASGYSSVGNSPAGTRCGNKRKSFAMRLPLSNFFSDGGGLDDDGVIVTAPPRHEYSEHSPVSPDSPHPPLSQSGCSSNSNHGHVLSPLTERSHTELDEKVRIAGIDTPPQGYQELPELVEPANRPKRTRSFVDNVRGFFIPRSSSPSPSQSSTYSSQVSNRESQTSSEEKVEKSNEHVFVRLWRHASLRQRVRSAPDVPGNDSSKFLAPSHLPLPTIHSPPPEQPNGYSPRPSGIMGVHMHVRHSSDDGQTLAATSRQNALGTSPSPLGVQRRRSVFSSGKSQFSLSKRVSNSRLVPSVSALTPLTPMVVEKAA